MMTRILHPLLSLLASVTRQELARQVAYLKTENRLLRARLPGRIVTTEKERLTLLRAGRKLGTQLSELMTIVSYDSFRRWIREEEDARGKKKEQTPEKAKRKPGRPKTAEEIRELVIRIRKETSYGYTKILQELRRMGVKLSRQTVKNILVAAGIPPEPNDLQDNWDNFLRRHAATLWQCDFCSKAMWTARGIVDVYLLVFLHLGTRRVWISPATVSPDAAWVEQQARNFLMHAEDVALPVEWVLRDRDTKYTRGFDEILKSEGVRLQLNTPASPNLRAHVERMIQILKHECLNWFVVVSLRHLNVICGEFQTWYNQERGHSSRGHLPRACEKEPEPVVKIRPGDVVCTTRLGGFLKSYSRRAA